MKLWMKILIGALVVILIAGIGYLGFRSNSASPKPQVQAPTTLPVGRCTVQQSVSAPGSAVNTHAEGVQMPADGELSQILVRAGDAVSQGQTLARLKSPEKYSEALAAARLGLLEAQRALDDLKSQAPLKTSQAYSAMVEAQKKLDDARKARQALSYKRATKETIDIARSNLVLLKTALDNAQSHYDSLSNLDENDTARVIAFRDLAAARQSYNQARNSLDWLQGTPSGLDITQADAAAAQAEAQFKTAQAEWTRLKDGADSLELQQAQNKVDQAKAKVALAETASNSVEVKAPFSGVVTEVKAQAGMPLATGAVILTLMDPRALEVQSSIVEEDLPLLNVGMPASLYFDALGGNSVNGKVARIIPQRISGDQPRYLIRLSLDSIPDRLVDGMTADASIVVNEHKDVLCLPRTLVHASGSGKSQVEVWNGVKIEKRTVTVGLRGDTSIEIIDGLQEGEKVVSR